ncbi:MAG: 2-amino-4-hydroxy-6-hydroxymethyldihydropteridine diphosphokinase [Veillonellales bacterium]
MIALGLGSNIGDRESNIVTAIQLLAAHKNILIDAVSSLYETEPVGVKEQPEFLNAVIRIRTQLLPRELLAVCLWIEKKMGRVRLTRWGPRNIDIDLLVYETVELNVPELILPHPRLAARRFVLVPLVEIAGDEIITRGVTPMNLLKQTVDTQKVKLYKIRDGFWYD